MAVISCTLVFMAVFIPVTFMGGTSGIFYTQFGVTLATSVGLSMVSALVLCPALCAIMMRPEDIHKKQGSFGHRVKQAYSIAFEASLSKYKKGLSFLIGHRWLVWASLALASAGLIYLVTTTKTGLVPQEDQGLIMVSIGTSPGNTIEQSAKVLDKVENIIKSTPEVVHYARIGGFGLMGGVRYFIRYILRTPQALGRT